MNFPVFHSICNNYNNIEDNEVNCIHLLISNITEDKSNAKDVGQELKKKHITKSKNNKWINMIHKFLNET